MPISRRDFIKLFGIGVASLLVTRCQVFKPVVTCYDTVVPVTPPDPTARGRLRRCWLSFGELARRIREAANDGSSDESFSGELVTDHRTALDELVRNGELSIPVADLIHEAYGAAVYHIWRSNAPITCYEPMFVDYAPASAGVLVQQADILDDLSNQGTIDPETLARAQAALEHDMAFYALSETETQALYEEVMKASQEQGQIIPSFDQLQLEVTPDAKVAAEFIITLLAGK